jgi:hypothetical protein
MYTTAYRSRSCRHGGCTTVLLYSRKLMYLYSTQVREVMYCCTDVCDVCDVWCMRIPLLHSPPPSRLPVSRYARRGGVSSRPHLCLVRCERLRRLTCLSMCRYRHLFARRRPTIRGLLRLLVTFLTVPAASVALTMSR